mgnify:CR=1 FL=1
MKLYLVRYTWRGERYLTDDLDRVLALQSRSAAEELIEWEMGDWTESEKDAKRHRFAIIEIDVPFLRGIDR